MPKHKIDNPHESPLAAWEQRANETQRAYEAFCLYRDMGAARSLDKVRQKLGRDSAGYTRQLEKWSSLYEWVDRVKVWDAHQRALLDTQLAEAKAQLVKDGLADYTLQLGKFREVFAQTKLHMKTAVQKLPDGTQVQLVELNTGDWLTLSRWRASIEDLGRRSLGMPEKITQSQLTGEDGGQINHELTLKVDDLAGVFRELAQWHESNQHGDPNDQP